MPGQKTGLRRWAMPMTQRLRRIECGFSAAASENPRDAVDEASNPARSGVAMGQRRSNVSREVADLVLLDDTFATGALLAFALGLREESGGLLVPLTAAQILWINLMTDGLPALTWGLAEGVSRLVWRRQEGSART